MRQLPLGITLSSNSLQLVIRVSCPRCGYDLTAHVADQPDCACPECGESVTVKRLERIGVLTRAAWPCWVATVLLSGFLLGSASSAAATESVFGLTPRSRFLGTSIEIRDAVMFGAPILWGLIAVVTSAVCAGWLNRSGRRSQGVALRFIGLVLFAVGGGAWIVFQLFARIMRSIPPP